MVWANITPKRYTSSLTSPIPAAALSCCSLNHETGHRSLSCLPCKFYHGHFEAAGNCKTLWSRSLDCGTCQCRECCWMKLSTISDKSEKLYTYKVASWTFSNGYIVSIANQSDLKVQTCPSGLCWMKETTDITCTYWMWAMAAEAKRHWYHGTLFEEFQQTPL